MWPPFNAEIEELIRNEKIIVACDALVKNGVMGVYWMIIILDKQLVAEKELYSKNWELNLARIAEAIILLDVINVIREKILNIEEGKIVVATDNGKIKKTIDRSIEIANQYN